jgi:hypothetical protein
MINFNRIKLELFKQANISNRDIFYSEYKLRLRGNPEDLTNFSITQDNLNKYLPFLKEEEVYYLQAIANDLNIGNNKAKDQIEEHNKQYGTNFSINNFKEIYSKNLNLLLNYIDSLKPKNNATIYIDRSALAIYYILNLSLFNILLYKGKVNQELINNLPENKIIIAINRIKNFIKRGENDYNNNQNIINKIKQDIIPKLESIKIDFNKIKAKTRLLGIGELCFYFDKLFDDLVNLTPYSGQYTTLDYINDFLKNFNQYFKLVPINKEINEHNEHIYENTKGLLKDVSDLMNNFEDCDNLNSLMMFIMHDQEFFEYSWGQHLDSNIEKELEFIYKRSGERLLVSDSNEYVRLIISDFIKKDQ